MSQEFHLKIGDKVCHYKESKWEGVIVQIDKNLIESGITTCLVQWTDDVYPNKETGDIQWSNKLIKID